MCVEISETVFVTKDGSTPTEIIGGCYLRWIYIRDREPGGVHETLMIAKHETCIDFYGASEKWI